MQISGYIKGSYVMNDIYYELINYIEKKPVINTHSHHMKDDFFEGFNLGRLIDMTYVGKMWTGLSFDETYISRKEFLDKVRYKSDFTWLQIALQKLYATDETLTADNWDKFSHNIEVVYKDKHTHIKILKNQCHYEKVILDAYWEPGSDNSYKDFFTPTFRVNMFGFGYSREARDHNGNNALVKYGKHIDNIDDYISFMRKCIIEKKRDGCISLKCAIPYERGLDIEQVSKEKVQCVFKKSKECITKEEIKSFQDYVLFQICEIAAELDMPMQWHVGLGKLKRTNGMWMYDIIDKNPSTKFVLFHGGYPWMDDVAGLLHYFKNVYCDICWLPIISTSSAERMLCELIEVGTSDKLCWGCDTCTSEESYGAVLAARHVVANVLAGKVEDGFFSINDAQYFADNILHNNAKNLYKMK